MITKVQTDKSIKSYEKARDLFIDWCSDIKGATPVEFGSVGSPGLSDLDLGIVFSNELDFQNLSDILQKKVKSFPNLVNETMNGGTLMLFPERSFFNILYADDLNINSFDSKIDIASISKSDEKYVSKAQVLEWLPERIIKIYMELNKTQINTKRLVGYYYSLCYSLSKVNKFCGENQKINEFIGNIYLLRNQWDHLNSKERKERFKWFELNYMVVCKIAISNFNEKNSDYFNAPKSLLNKVYKYNLYSNVFLISSNNSLLSDIVKYENGMINLYVPPIFLVNYFIYSLNNSKLGELIKIRTNSINEKKLHLDNYLSSKMNSILNIRIKMFSEFFTFVDKLGLGTGLYKFGWYLNDKKTI